MIQIAIVEDDLPCREELKSFLLRYQKEKNCCFVLDDFASADAFLDSFHSGEYQMIFLDIEMPGTNGMEAAKRLRKTDDDVLLFFVTNLSQYALESYEVQAFNFMVKPIAYNNFFLKMERAIERIRNGADDKLIVPVKEEDQTVEKVIRISDIRYVEVYNHRMVYHTVNGEMSVREGSMKSVSSKLEPYGFAMCDQSYLVNLRYITAVDKEEVYVGKDVVKISRRKRAEFLSALSRNISFGRTKK